IDRATTIAATTIPERTNRRDKEAPGPLVFRAWTSQAPQDLAQSKAPARLELFGGHRRFDVLPASSKSCRATTCWLSLAAILAHTTKPRQRNYLSGLHVYESGRWDSNPRRPAWEARRR